MASQQLRRSQRKHLTKSLHESPPPQTPRRVKSSRKPKDSDYDYRPPPDEDEPQSSVYVSPKRNSQWKEDVKSEARQAVLEDSVHGTFCAICRDSNQQGHTYETAHIVDQSLAGNQETVSVQSSLLSRSHTYRRLYRSSDWNKAGVWSPGRSICTLDST